MASLNKVQLIGNLGRDPEMRYMPDGTPTATISIATSKTWKDRDSGEQKESTEWHRVVFFRGLAEVVEKYLEKGSQVYVEGELKTRSFKDKDDGHDVYVTEIRAKELIMLGGKRKGDGGKPEAPAGQKFQDQDDDVPF